MRSKNGWSILEIYEEKVNGYKRYKLHIPAHLVKLWNISKGDQIMLIPKGGYAIIVPTKHLDIEVDVKKELSQVLRGD